jgi:homoaconitate hydratase
MPTMIEKIAGGSSGEFIRISPKHIMTHDNTSAVMGKFNAIGATKIHDPKQPVFAIDHDIQNKSESNLGKYAKIEKFADEQGVDFYPAGTGISHQVMIERGYVTPGSMVVGSDSHSNMYGALACLGTPVVRTDAASIWAIGETWWQVPKIARVWLRGKTIPGAGIVGKDVIIALCGIFNNDEVLNHAIEFAGEGIACLSMEDRLTISNMTTEWGALAGVFPFDETLRGWLTDRAEWLQVRRTPRYTPEDVQNWWEHKIETDDDAVFNIELELDLATVIPHVSGPDHVKVMRSLPEIEQEKLKIDKAYLLSCTNARIEDLVAASEVVDGKQVADGVQFYVAAASEVVQEKAEQLGAWQKLEAAGVIFLPSGCGTCIGLGEGTLEPGEVGISATNRNFKGRMGSRDAKAYLASPAIVAASAINGYISSSTKYDDVEPVGTVISKSEPSSSTGSVDIIDGFPKQVTGRVLWLPVDNMNTDGIYSGVMTYKDDVTEEEMADAAMCNYDPEFKDIALEGDILVSGYNFGTGSSREQAATCLKVRGIPCVIAASFSETYKRNAINNGFLVIDSPTFVDHLRETLGTDAPTIVGDEITIDFTTATIIADDKEFKFSPLGPVPQEVIVAGGAEAVVAQKLQSSP